jgi:hypothetical protein
LDYNILRNPARRAEHYLKCVTGFAAFGAGILYRNRDMDLGSPPDLSGVRADIDAVVQHWAAQGIEVGSSQALEMDLISEGSAANKRLHLTGPPLRFFATQRPCRRPGK